MKTGLSIMLRQEKEYRLTGNADYSPDIRFINILLNVASATLNVDFPLSVFCSRLSGFMLLIAALKASLEETTCICPPLYEKKYQCIGSISRYIFNSSP